MIKRLAAQLAFFALGSLVIGGFALPLNPVWPGDFVKALLAGAVISAVLALMWALVVWAAEVLE